MLQKAILETRRGLATAVAGGVRLVPLENIRASLILSRTPIVTPDMSESDKKFYKYQEQLERRLMWTFPKWFYFKKGTVAEREFTKAQKYPIPSHPGVWFPKGLPDIKHERDRRFRQDIILPKKAPEEESGDMENETRAIKLNSRITEADKKNDQASLERKLARTLYLLVKQDGQWKFPTFPIENEDVPLNEVAENGLRRVGGNKINTWNVSRTPAGILKYSNGKLLDCEQSESSSVKDSSIVRDYLIKSHILAGKFVPQDNQGVEAYKWLVKEELEPLLGKAYFSQVDFLLSKV